MKTRPAPSPKSPAPAPHGSLQELDSTLREIAARRAAVVADILRREARNEHLFPEKDSAPRKAREARAQALTMLNGAATAHLAVPDRGRSYAEARSELEAIDIALDEGGRLRERLRIEEANRRIKEHAAEIKETMRRIATCLLDLESSLQERDKLIADLDIHGIVTMAQGWAFCGRLANTASQLFRFMQTATSEGWIEKRQFKQAYDRARRASEGDYAP